MIDQGPVHGHGARAIKRTLFRHASKPSMLKNNQEKGLGYGEIGDRFGVGASTAFENVNIAGSDDNLCRLVPVAEHGAQICARDQQKAMLGYVHTGQNSHRHQVWERGLREPVYN